MVAWRDAAVASRSALKALARRILSLSDEIAALDGMIKPLVAELGPGLIDLEGIGVENAGALIVAAGDNPERLKSEASFAMMCGASPIPASSGKTQRHRLNRGGNRQLNSALHMVVVCRMRTDQRTKSYVARSGVHPCRRTPRDQVFHPSWAGLSGTRPMRRHRRHSIEFKRQVARGSRMSLEPVVN